MKQALKPLAWVRIAHDEKIKSLQVEVTAEILVAMIPQQYGKKQQA